MFLFTGKGGKNRRRGKNENESEKRELVFKEDGQGKTGFRLFCLWVRRVAFTSEVSKLVCKYCLHNIMLFTENCQVNKTLTAL